MYQIACSQLIGVLEARRAAPLGCHVAVDGTFFCTIRRLKDSSTLASAHMSWNVLLGAVVGGGGGCGGVRIGSGVRRGGSKAKVLEANGFRGRPGIRLALGPIRDELTDVGLEPKCKMFP